MKQDKSDWPDGVDFIDIGWLMLQGDHPAIYFCERAWAKARSVAAELGYAPPQDLITTGVTGLIKANVKAGQGPTQKVKLEWFTAGRSADESTEALLMFTAPTLTNIARMWQHTEADVQAVIAALLLESLGLPRMTNLTA
jgi:hypothetical protein